MPTIVEIKQERGQHVAAMRKILDRAETAKLGLSVEEKVEYDRLDKAQEELGERATRQQKQDILDRAMATSPEPTAGRIPPGEPAPTDRAATIPKAFRGLHERSGPALRARLEAQSSPAYRAAFVSYLLGDMGLGAVAATPEVRALQADTFILGGALVPPLEFIAQLIQAVDDEVFIRRLATKQTVLQAEGLGVPTLDADPADADWTSELGTGSADASMAFGKRELRPHPLAKRIKVSKKLLRASGINVESLVMGRLGYKFGITQEKAFMTGSGVQQPIGLFTASADGIPTSRDVSTDNTTTAITSDGLINAKHELKGQYWGRAQWIFHRNGVRMIRKLKDGNGQYLWNPGLVGNIPDRILESPYNMSEYVPNTFTTGLYVGMIGDFSRYWVVDALDLTVQRLVELYAETNQDGFIGRLETDGAPVLAEAFVRLKLA